MAKVAVYYPIMSPPVERALQTVDDWELACEQALGWAKDSHFIAPMSVFPLRPPHEDARLSTVDRNTHTSIEELEHVCC